MKSRNINEQFPGLNKEELEKQVRAFTTDYIDVLKEHLSSKRKLVNVMVAVRYKDEDGEEYDDIRAIGPQIGSMQLADTYTTEAFFTGLSRLVATMNAEEKEMVYCRALIRLRTSLEMGTVAIDSVERILKAVNQDCPAALEGEEGILLMMTALARIKADTGMTVEDVQGEIDKAVVAAESDSPAAGDEEFATRVGK